MSVTAHVDPDGVREPCFVAADGSGTVGALLAAVHGALALDRPVEEWEFFFVDGDGVEVPLCEDGAARLEDVGIVGAKEKVVARLGEMYVRRQKLRARGIDGEDAAWDRYLTFFVPSRGPLDEEEVALAKLIAGSGWVAKSYRPCGIPALHLVVQLAPEESTKEIIQLLVEGGSDLHETSDPHIPWCYGDVTPLHCAVAVERSAAVQALIECGANVNAIAGAGRVTALHQAAAMGCMSMVRVLLDGGADVNPTVGCGVLATAANHGRIEVVRALLQAGANINAVHDNYNCMGTALCDAAGEGFVDVVRVLLDGGADMYWHRKHGARGITPLHCAARDGRVEVIHLLLDRHASVNALVEGDEWEEATTPLHMAAANGHQEAMGVLLRRGAAADAADSTGLTPLHYASSRNDLPTIRTLLEHDANVNVPTGTSSMRPFLTPLHLATRPDVMRVLLTYGAAVNVRDMRGWTPLHEAASKGVLSGMRALLDHGASVDAQTEDGKTPLDVASSEEAKALLKEAVSGWRKRLLADTGGPPAKRRAL
eukprot:TRINITY_DN3259_c0_g1_i1.p1 TRINITY_DN3259_c0_g1~~TRINITY_DN3259_c0_g1_i1.p1  ORF type:complete len:540 (+),score=155.24 TRINITY_DN3259_c0_g1_i1:69-1688(+)